MLSMARLKNKRWERFARCYATNGFNASAAARAVGYSVLSCQNQGHRLTSNEDIVKRVAELTAGVDDSLVMSAQELLEEASKLAGFSLKDITDEDGRIIPVEQMDDDAAVSVNEVESEPFNVLQADGSTRTMNVITKIKAGRDKKFGMDLLAKYHNLLEAHQQAGANINTIIIDEKDAQA